MFPADSHLFAPIPTVKSAASVDRLPARAFLEQFFEQFHSEKGKSSEWKQALKDNGLSESYAGNLRRLSRNLGSYARFCQLPSDLNFLLQNSTKIRDYLDRHPEAAAQWM